VLWVVAVAYFGFEVQLTLPAEPQWFYSEDDVVLITKSDGSLWRAYVGFMPKTLC